MSDPFIGEIRIVGFNFAPRGWAFCDGQIMSIAQNTALFALLGTTYGGNGTTNFALPDLRDRGAMNMGSGPGLTPRSEGENGGAASITLITTELAGHSHIAKASGNLGESADPTNAVWSQTGTPRSQIPMYTTALGAGSAMNIGAITPAGQSNPHNNMQPCLTLNFVIALQGVFPQRP
ncbi:phage tail protein [Kouleothrix aurantiaca]|jgi:microcystin-dependent protein|uniref:Phage tail protein n=1 Tax=Kouleothrix aurantiaca TaxID=186479 RepID=A0A0P9FEF0_9CHLR|nr:phage tail protein [Kouleothrix aurantiaca]